MNEFILEKYNGEEDFEQYAKLVFNEHVMNMNMGRVFTDEEAHMFYDYIMENNNEGGNYAFYKVFLSSTKEYIGMASISKNDDFNGAEIEYMLLPEYWHKGYATKLVKILLKMIKTFEDINKVVAITNPDNVYSRKILLNNGFKSVKVYKTEDDTMAELFERVLEQVNY